MPCVFRANADYPPSALADIVIFAFIRHLQLSLPVVRVSVLLRRKQNLPPERKNSSAVSLGSAAVAARAFPPAPLRFFDKADRGGRGDSKGRRGRRKRKGRRKRRGRTEKKRENRKEEGEWKRRGRTERWDRSSERTGVVNGQE